MMARRLHWLPVAGVILGCQACSRDLEVLPDEACADHDADAVVVFTDSALESAVRRALSLGPEQDLTCDFVQLVRTLDAPSAEITSLAGIQNLTAMAFLVLSGSSVTDLGPLRGLASLRSITLDGSADLADVRPLIDNPEIGSGDLVYLRGTQVSCAEVAALAAEGATVFSNCVGLWPGDGSADDAFGTNEGSIAGDVTFAPGRVGQAFSFDAPGSHVRTAEIVDVESNAPRTVAAWVKSAGVSASQCCPTPFSWGAASTDGGFGIYIRDGMWWFWGYNDDTATGVRVDEEWNHHAITYDASVVRYYLNGRPVAEARRALNTTASRLFIGTGFDLGPGRQFIGMVDELVIFDRVLRPVEIEALFATY